MDDEKPNPKSSRRKTRITTKSSDNAVVARRKRFTDRNISGAWRGFRTALESVPEALKGTKIVPLSELAQSLGVEPKRLLPALEHGYLKLVSSDPPVVYEPPPAAMDWLRVMYQPLSLRPFLSSKMVGELEGLSAESVRRLCLDYNIPIYSDPVFGELMSISAFYRFHQQMYSHRDPSRFDRQAMLWTLLHLQKEGYRNINPPDFSRRMELEIQRISNLDEPARTDAALRLWDSWVATKKVWNSIAAAKGLDPEEGLPKTKKLEQIIRVEAPPSDPSNDTPVSGSGARTPQTPRASAAALEPCGHAEHPPHDSENRVVIHRAVETSDFSGEPK